MVVRVQWRQFTDVGGNVSSPNSACSSQQWETSRIQWKFFKSQPHFRKTERNAGMWLYLISSSALVIASSRWMLQAPSLSVESLAWTHFFLPGGINRLMTSYAPWGPYSTPKVHLLSGSQGFQNAQPQCLAAACEKTSRSPPPPPGAALTASRQHGLQTGHVDTSRMSEGKRAILTKKFKNSLLWAALT